jgi:membrane protein implicated in regulation of membrane protease activity
VDELTEWLGDNAWAGWFGLAVVLGIVELTTLDLVFLMIAGGALVGAAASLLGAPLLLQVVLALAASAALLGVVRPVARRHLESAPSTATGAAALVGRSAVVTARVDATGGQVKLAGEIWSARSFDERDVLEPGQAVEVYAIDGATAVVYRVEGITA